MEAVDVAPLLTRTAEGDASARAALLDVAYDHLRRIARRQMAAERAGHTLSATALVHEAFLKLADQDDVIYQNRSHFLAIASLAMRRVLVSHARKGKAAKRGSAERAVTLDDQVGADGLAIDDVVALEVALNRLAELSERQALVVSYRTFGAMTDAEIAETLSVAVPTVRRDYRVGVAWLRREMSGG